MAEAVEDGHLGETERASFQRHAVDCADCSRATAELAHLREVMSQLPAPAMSDIERHRQRALLIERAYSRVVRSGSRTRRLSFTAVVAVGALVVALVGVAWLRWPTTTTSHPTLAEKEPVLGTPSYEVTPLQKADWTREEAGNVARVRLTHGSAEFHVHPLKAGQRFLVALPDGEIEVRGTRFVVAVKAGETRYVVVTEGKVVWRRPPDSERLLLAGDRWDRPLHAEIEELSQRPVLSGSRSPSVAKPRGHEGRTVALVAESGGPSKRQVEAPKASHPSLSPALAPAPAPAPALASSAPESAAPTRTPALAKNGQGISADLFADGIAAFRAGRYEDADKLLMAFSIKNPSDPRTEDAAFLRAVSRARLGDDRAAGALAREYLRRFPKGLRRPEAESLSTRAP
jgi:hypothetical protein